MEKNYCVYVHTNKTNGKRYVGITSMEPEKRWAKGYGYRSNVLFYRAIQKYGWDGFDHDILACGLTKQEAYKMEVATIANYDLVNPKKGYNLDHGGNGSNRLTEKTRAILSQKSREYALAHPENGQRLANYAKTHRAELAEKTKARFKNNPEAAREHGRKMKQVWAAHPEIVKESRQKCREYYDLHPEARKLKSDQIRQYYEKHPEAREHNSRKMREYYTEHPERKKCKPVIQFDKNMKMVQWWDSIKSASDSLGICGANITAVCRGRRQFAGDYVWRYLDDLQNEAI